MTRIGSGGTPPKDPEALGRTPAETKPAELRAKESVPKAHDTAGKEKIPQKDIFERAVPLIEKQLQAMSGKALAGKIRFSSEHLAALAAAFAGILKQHPRADRKERARLFARTILRNKRLGKVLDNADERDLERMFDTIADQLEGSPVFAQLVDDVTEGARKISLG